MTNDEYFMHLALLESKKARSISYPNPDVGAVIVKNNKLISTGYTREYGKEHAEVMAVKNAKSVSLNGAVMYVTLEPCSHFGKTPPCTDLIIKHKFKRVVIGMVDPNPIVCGSGILKLKRNNISVTVGVLRNKIEESLQWFIKYIKTKTSYITLKSGISIDGKIADFQGRSKWITSSSSLKLSQQLRAENAGIIAGINTVLKDNPTLTYRGNKKKGTFTRIIFDTNLRIPYTAEVLKSVKNHNTLIITSNKTKKIKKIEKIKSLGNNKILFTGEKDGKIDIKSALKLLYKEKLSKLILEGGAALNYSFLKEGFVDKILLFIAPKIIGGKNSIGFVGGRGFNLLNSVKIKNGRFINYVNDDFIFEGVINKYVHRYNRRYRNN